MDSYHSEENSGRDYTLERHNASSVAQHVSKMHMLCTTRMDVAQHLCGPISFPNPLIHFAGVHTQGALGRDSPGTCVQFLHAKGKVVLTSFTLMVTIQAGYNLAKDKQKLPSVIPKT